MLPTWNDDECRMLVDKLRDSFPVPFIEQVYATRLLGSSPSLAMHGGGNTSCKTGLKDLLGDEIGTLFVKASGCDMAEAEAGDFVPLNLQRLRRLEAMKDFDDTKMADFFRLSYVRNSDRRPSIETLLHAFLPFTFVDHTHPSAILALANRHDADECIRSAITVPVAVLPYTQVGIDLARAVSRAAAAMPGCKGIIIAHHGLVTWGESAREACDATLSIVKEAGDWLRGHRQEKGLTSTTPPSTDLAKKRYRELAPVIRGCLVNGLTTDATKRPCVSLVHLGDERTLSLLEHRQFRSLLISAPPSPDYIIRTRRLPLLLEDVVSESPEQFTARLDSALVTYAADCRAFFKNNSPEASDSSAATIDTMPRVLLIPGTGIVCAGATHQEARTAADITVENVNVKADIFETGGTYLDLDDDHCFNMEFRPYQRAKLSGSGNNEPMRGRVVLVTGAAGAIGSGLCTSLLENGFQVAVSDLPGERLDQLVDGLSSRFGIDNLIPVPMDITDEQSVNNGFMAIVDRFGGLDGVVVNAGIAHVSTLAEMDFEAFKRLERVNTDGTLLTIREAARLFTRQHCGGDIVLISTKNVFAPGASFGAYSATKAASHQIARIASLELASVNVRVNMVAPDAVFSHGAQKSGLWATVGPDRMRSRGLDEQGLEEYYRNRNLLKAKVTASHVAEAVMFFLKRSTPTTGATIPVDGGLPDATPR